MKVVISMMEHLGDVVACEPVARLVRKLHPDAPIYWVTSTRYAAVVRNNPFIDSVVELGCLGEWAKLQANLDAVVYDLNVDQKVCAHCGEKLVKRSNSNGVDCHNWLDYGALLPTFMRGAGLPEIHDQPKFWRQATGLRVNQDLLGRRYAVIHAKSNDRAKDWHAEGWAQVAAWLRARQYRVVEVGLADSGIPGVDFFPSQDIQEIATLIDGADLFLGIDSGFAHVANALEKPSVILLGKYRHWDRYFPYTGGFFERSVAVRPDPVAHGPFVSNINPENVISAIQGLKGIAHV